MSIISDVFNFFQKIMNMGEKNYSCKRYSRIIRIVASFICLFTLLQRYFNVLEIDLTNYFPLWDKRVRDYLDDSYKVVIIIWIIFDLFWINLASRISVKFEEIGNKEMRPVLSFIGDLVDAFSSIIYLGEAINVFIYYQNSYFPMTEFNFLFCCALCHIIVLGMIKVFNENKNFWIHMDRNYLDYYDCKGRNLYVGASVVYYGKRYKVIEVKSGVEKDNNMILFNHTENETIELAQAVKDKDGQLTIMYWKRGRTIDNFWV